MDGHVGGQTVIHNQILKLLDTIRFKAKMSFLISEFSVLKPEMGK